MNRIIIKLRKSVIKSPDFIGIIKKVTGNDYVDYLIDNYINNYNTNIFNNMPLFKTIPIGKGTVFFDNYSSLNVDFAKEYLDDLIDQFDNCPDVEIAYISEDPEPLFVPNDPEWQLLWHYHKDNTYSTNAEQAWDDPDIEFGKGIVIATIEPLSQGCNFNHKDFGMVDSTPQERIEAMKNGTHPALLASKFNNEWDIPVDNFGHATQTASMIVAQINNNQGHTGIIPQGKVKVFYYGHAPQYDGIHDAIIRAAIDHEVDVISVSLTGNRDDIATITAIQLAFDLGVPVVWAAGPNTDGYESWFTAPNAISVSSHDKNGSARFETGNISVSAPGIGIFRSSPGDDNPVLTNEDNFQYGYGSGNSLATPIVAGIIGMMLKKNKKATLSEVISALFYSCTKINTNWSKTYGYGCVNANRAVMFITNPINAPLLTPTRLKTTYSSYKKKFSWYDPFRTSLYKETIIVAIPTHTMPEPLNKISKANIVYRGTGKYLGNGQYETENYIWLKKAEYWFTIFNIDIKGNATEPQGLDDCNNDKARGYISCYKSATTFYTSPDVSFSIDSPIPDGNGVVTGQAPLVVKFNDNSTGNCDSDYLLWDFGDGGTSKKRNPEYIYTKPGVYTVQFTCGNPIETSAMIEPDMIKVISNEIDVRDEMRKVIIKFCSDITGLIDKL